MRISLSLAALIGSIYGSGSVHVWQDAIALAGSPTSQRGQSFAPFGDADVKALAAIGIDCDARLTRLSDGMRRADSL